MKSVAWLVYAAVCFPFSGTAGEETSRGNLKAWRAPEVTAAALLDPTGKPSLRELRVDLARGGEAFKLLYLASDPPLAPAFELSEAGSVRLREVFWVRDHLLIPYREVEPAEDEKTGIFWLWFEADSEAPPASLEAQVVIRNGKERLNLPLRARVHGWQSPPYSRLSLTSYSLSIGLFGGLSGLLKDPERKRQSAELIAALVEAGGDTLDLSPTPGEIWPRTKVMATGQPLLEAIEESPELFRKRTLPHLDFSALSAYVDEAIWAGLNRCILHGWWVEGIGGGIPEKLLGPQAAPGQADYDRILVWLLSELGRFLRQRGFAEVFFKLADEVDATTVDLWIENARLVRQAGLRTMGTWTGYIPRQPVTRRRLAPWVDEWQMQLLSAHWVDRKADVENGLLAPDARVSVYGGGSGVLTLPTTAYRYLGWLAAYYRLDGFGVWAFYWWQPQEKMVTFQDGRLRWSPSYLGLRQAMEEGETLARALDGLETLERRAAVGPLTPTEQADLEWAREEYQRLIGLREEAAVRLEWKPHTQYMPAINYDHLNVADPEPTTFDAARGPLFELAQRVARYAPSAVYYGPALLCDELTPPVIVTLSGDASAQERACAERIREALRRHTGATITPGILEHLTTEQKRNHSVIHVGEAPSSYRYHDYAIEVNDYPSEEPEEGAEDRAEETRTDEWVIYHASSPYDAARQAIFLVGRDDHGTAQATEAFLKCLSYRGLPKESR